MRRFNKCPKSQDIFNILLSYFCFILLVWKTHNFSKLTQLSASTLTRILVYCSPHRWYYLEDNSTRLKSFNKDLISNSLLWVLSPGFPTSPWMNNRLSKSMFSKIFHFSFLPSETLFSYTVFSTEWYHHSSSFPVEHQSLH